MDVSTARQLARYRAWAEKLTYEAVAALPRGEAETERPTLFKTIIGTLNRNYLIDRVWQAHVEGRDHGVSARNLMLHAELSELWAAQQDMKSLVDRVQRHSIRNRPDRDCTLLLHRR
jgi:uncharacterized damage-inducible protein DinB